jgi:hypothetical protein
VSLLLELQQRTRDARGASVDIAKSIARAETVVLEQASAGASFAYFMAHDPIQLNAVSDWARGKGLTVSDVQGTHEAIMLSWEDWR